VGLGFKWAADFMQMKDNSKWLVVQDITSREAWVSRDSAVSAFSSILERADSLPKVLITDADPIFTSKVFQEMLRERDILHTIRQGRQDLATVDNLIARIKRVAAQEELEGGKVEIPKIVEQFNKTGAKVLHGATPVEMKDNDSLRFQREWEEAQDIEDNVHQANIRRAKLLQAGAFRILVKRANKKDIRRRVFETLWSRELFPVDRLEGPYVYSGDRRFLTKEVLPAYRDSNAVQQEAASVSLNTRAREVLRRYADFGVQYLMGVSGHRAGAQKFGSALSRAGNIKQAIELAKLPRRAPGASLVRVFPDLFKMEVVGGKPTVALV
jgi:hypothetical protein